ncbi:esterase/lipase family protein [Dactylosporangium sp. CA-092794]|uniref:esterase/lipase family protein n=1 Tax=Dactylosporangium sp. CA-092794 TaxID=3239929 RepID=UPI003D8A25F1
MRPLVLVRGFGGPSVTDEQASTYQGFNDGSVYPGRRGDNYIYEGFVLRAMKSERYPYRDATNVVGYYAEDVPAPPDPMGFADDIVKGSVVLDPPVAKRILERGVNGTMWIYRYYDLKPRAIVRYGQGLARLIDIIRQGAERRGEAFAGVDIVAHSMGGLIVRTALRHMKDNGIDTLAHVHRVVTLGAPHRGIAFQRLPRWLVDAIPGVRDAGDEVAAFDPNGTEFLDIERCFDPRRVLTVVGTDHRGYGVRVSSTANRIATLFDEGTLAHNHSDGLVKQSSAQLPGSPRTFVHKCHGGYDSLVTSREAYEIAMRFLHGTHRVRLWLDAAEVSRGGDFFSRSEFYLGVSIKPRYVDFELFHQSPPAENCYGPFHDPRLTDDLPDLKSALREPLADADDAMGGWAGPHRLVWEGWLDARNAPAGRGDVVFRMDVYVGERDSFGIGFSDNVVFRKQYYIQALLQDGPPDLFVHTGEQHLGAKDPADRRELEALAGTQATADVQRAQPATRPDEWTFHTAGTGFTATWRIALEREPADRG